MSGSGARPRFDERRSRYAKFFDSDARRLVYVGAAADSEFWDRRWMETRLPKYAGAVSRRSLVVRETTRFLEPGSLILEGGCGLAVNSWRLRQLGYRTVALDYAQKTLSYVTSRAPEVCPLAGDVGRLPLASGSVDGYWSLGVIEHFYDGYAAIRDEMQRVVRPGGYLFLTFPAMNGLRRGKSLLGLYPRWRPESDDLARFYQFALPFEGVAADFEASGFKLVRKATSLGASGVFEELGGPGRWLDARLSGASRPVRLARAALDTAVRPLSHHLRLLVLHRLPD